MKGNTVFQIVLGNKYLPIEARPVRDQIFDDYQKARDEANRLNRQISVHDFTRYMVQPVEIKIK